MHGESVKTTKQLDLDHLQLGIFTRITVLKDKTLCAVVILCQVAGDSNPFFEDSPQTVLLQRKCHWPGLICKFPPLPLLMWVPRHMFH